MKDVALMPPHEPPFKRKDVRDLYWKGTWAYALGKPAWTHPEYKKAVAVAKRGRAWHEPFNPWWIRNWADVNAVFEGCFMDEQLGRLRLDFTACCRQYIGRHAGKPLTLADWQIYDIKMPMFGWSRRNGTRRYRRGFIEIPKKNGKALAVDTPIPTPTGWTTMGDISVGDIVFDQAGKPCRVTFVTDAMYGHKCYRVRFSDGSSVVADAEHLWETYTRKPERVKPSIWTTEQIAGSLHIPYSGCAGWNHSIPITKPLLTEAKDLPIHPYALGVWLGDGNSDGPTFTCHPLDAEIVERIRSLGIRIRPRKSIVGKTQQYSMLSPGDLFERDSIRGKLVALGILGKKRIPDVYLRASVRQRSELLKGLMDTDGTISKAGQCSFCTIRQELASGFIELTRSLGFKPTLSTKTAKCNDKDCGICYQVQFWGFADDEVFFLTRKRKRLRARPGKKQRSRNRHIVAVEPVASVPVKCIQVDSPRHLYLCGEGMIPTHNTTDAAENLLYFLVGDGERGAEVYSAAVDHEQNEKIYDAVFYMGKASPALRGVLGFIRSKWRITYPLTGSFYKALSGKAISAEGKDIHAAVVEELHVHPTALMHKTIKHGGRARSQPFLCDITTAGLYDPTGIGYTQHQLALKILFAQDKAHLIYQFFAYVCRITKEEEDRWAEPAMAIKANPNMGVTIQLDDDMDDCREAKSKPEDIADIKRYLRNVWVNALNTWIPVTAWEKCAGSYTEDDLEGMVCYPGIDVSASEDVTALVLWFPPQKGLAKHRFLVYTWIPEDKMQSRDEETSGLYTVWKDNGFIYTTPGKTINQEAIRKKINELGEKFVIKTIAYDRAFAIKLAMDLEEDGFDTARHGQGFEAMNEPTTEFKRLVDDEEVEHPDHPVMNAHMANACVIRDSGDRCRIIKNTGAGRGKAKVRLKVDCVIASIMGLSASRLDEEGPNDDEMVVTWL